MREVNGSIVYSKRVPPSFEDRFDDSETLRHRHRHLNNPNKIFGVDLDKFCSSIGDPTVTAGILSKGFMSMSNNFFQMSSVSCDEGADIFDSIERL